MKELEYNKLEGVLHRGWCSTVNDYAIAGGWALGGSALLVADVTGGLCAFDGHSGEILWQRAETHGAGLLAMAFHPNGELFATSGQDGRVLIACAKSGKVKRTIELGKGWVEHVSWSPNGQWLAISIARRIHLYRTDGTEAWRTEDHPSTVSSISWSGNSALATACYGRVTFFDTRSGLVSQKYDFPGSLVSMALSPDGEIVACGTQDNTVLFLHCSTGAESIMHGYPCKPSNLAFDHTGTLLATGGSHVVLVQSFQGGGLDGPSPGELDFHLMPITALSFAPHCQHLASGDREGAVIVWSIDNDGDGVMIGGTKVDDNISELLWKPNGRALAALDANGGVTTWRIQS